MLKVKDLINILLEEDMNLPVVIEFKNHSYNLKESDVYGVSLGTSRKRFVIDVTDEGDI
jgi:hypothetical protein